MTTTDHGGRVSPSELQPRTYTQEISTAGDNPRPVSRRIAGHQLVSDPTETVRVWKQLTTIVCHARAHDTLTAAKNHGCICPSATRTRQRYENRRRKDGRPRLIDAAPTARLLQALAALAWSTADLAPRLQLNRVTVTAIRSGRQAQVTGATARRAVSVYHQLKATPGPTPRTANVARRNGWTPPRHGGRPADAGMEGAA